MRRSRFAILLALLFALSLSPFSVGHTSPKPLQPIATELPDEQLIASYHGVETNEASTPDDLPGGIREEIPSKYVSRYQQWKEEFLSTEAGRNQWDAYQNN